MLRAVRLICWVLFLGPIVSFLVWVWLPRQNHEVLVEKSVEASDASFLKSQLKAKEQKLNGYLSERFLPVWGVGGTSDKQAEVSKTLSDWTERLDEGRGKPFFHFAMMKLNDPEYQKAQSAFAELSPELEKQAAKPVFAPDYGNAAGYSAALSFPNGVGVRQLARGLAGYGSALVAHGRFFEAVEAYLGAFNLAAHQSNGATFEEALVGMAIWEDASTELLLHLDPGTPLAESDWKKLATGLAKQVPTLDQFETVLSNQIAFDRHSLDLAEFNPLTHQIADGDVWVPRMLRWTGLTAREKRIYSNNLGSTLRSLGRGDLLAALPSEVRQPTTKSYVLGTSSWSAIAMSSSYERYQAALHMLRAKLAGLATVASLMEYEKTHQSFPETLAQLRESGATEPKGLPWSRSDYKYRKTSDGFDLLTPVPIEVMAQFAAIPGATLINAGSNYASVTVEGYRFRYSF